MFSVMMEQWTKKRGFPVITASLESFTDDCQEWRIDQRSCHISDNELKWRIPLSYATSSGASGTLMIEEASQTVTIPTKDNDIVKFNNDSTTFCQINYCSDYLETLCKNSAQFSVHNRMGLVNDINLSKRLSKRAKTNNLLTMMYHLKDLATEEKASIHYLYTMFKDALETLFITSCLPVKYIGEEDSSVETFLSQ